MKHLLKYKPFLESVDFKAQAYEIKKLTDYKYKIFYHDKKGYSESDYFEFQVEFLKDSNQFNSKYDRTLIPTEIGERQLLAVNIIFTKLKGTDIGNNFYGIMTSLKDVILRFIKEFRPIALVFIIKDINQKVATIEKNKKRFKLFNYYISNNIKKLKTDYSYYIFEKINAGYIIQDKYFQNFKAVLSDDEQNNLKYIK